jgi:hypothetical protein
MGTDTTFTGADTAGGSIVATGGCTGGRTFETLAATCSLLELARSCLGAAANGGRGAPVSVVDSFTATIDAWLAATGEVFRLEI